MDRRNYRLIGISTGSEAFEFIVLASQTPGQQANQSVLTSTEEMFRSIFVKVLGASEVYNQREATNPSTKGSKWKKDTNGVYQPVNPKPFVAVNKRRKIVGRFKNIKEAVAAGYNRSCVVRCLKGHRATHAGLKWMFV